MRLCDFQTGVGRLQRETKRLKDSWRETKVHWNDAAAKQFEEKYLEPLIPNIKLALAAIHELAEVVDDAERECGDKNPNAEHF